MNAPREWVVESDQAGERLDRILVQLLPEMTRSAVQRLIKDGCVLLDGQPARAADKPAAGHSIRLEAASARDPGRDPEGPRPQELPLEVVYEDEHLLVGNKPPDMVVHPAKAHQDGTLVNALLGYVAGREGLGTAGVPPAGAGTAGVPPAGLSAGSASFRPGIVHRLDQHTSGLLLVAKTDRAHAELSRQVEAHTARREYHALVWGWPEPARGTIRTGFGRHPQHRTMMAVREWGRGREAITHYQTAERYEWSWTAVAGERPRTRQAALVTCVLETGRTHQIRVHLEHRGNPILGDPLYGDRVRDVETPPELAALLAALPGQALHAARLSFRHPVTDEPMTLEAPPPPRFSALLRWFREETNCADAK